MTAGALDSPITTGKNRLSVAGTSARLTRRVKGLTYNVLAIIVSLIMVTPVCLVLINSLKTRVQASSMGIELPTVLQWQNFGKVIEQGKLGTAFGNSLLYAVAATLAGVTLSALAAYVL